MEKRNWSKNQETKFSETHFAQKIGIKICGREEHKNTWAKTFGDKHWCQKFETKKIREKYIKRNPKIKKLEQNFGKIKKLQTNVIVRNEKHNKNFGGKLENKSLIKI